MAQTSVPCSRTTQRMRCGRTSKLRHCDAAFGWPGSGYELLRPVIAIHEYSGALRPLQRHMGQRGQPVRSANLPNRYAVAGRSRSCRRRRLLLGNRGDRRYFRSCIGQLDRDTQLRAGEILCNGDPAAEWQSPRRWWIRLAGFQCLFRQHGVVRHRYRLFRLTPSRARGGYKSTAAGPATRIDRQRLFRRLGGVERRVLQLGDQLSAGSIAAYGE